MKTILVIREFDVFSRVLAANDYEIINLPLIETSVLDDLKDFENKLAAIEIYDGIFLTSRQAAKIFRAELVERKISYRGRVYVLGKRGYEHLRTENLDLVFFDSANTAHEMLEKIPWTELENKKFLFIRGEKSLRYIAEYLGDFSGIDEAIVYETRNISIEVNKIKFFREKFNNGEIICACFFSPSAAENFLAQFGAEITHQTIIAAIGKTTAQYFETRNLRVGFVSPKSNAETFAVELIGYLGNAAETRA